MNDEEPTNVDHNTEDKDCHQKSEGETEEGNISNTESDQDNEVSSLITPTKTSTRHKLKKKKIGSTT